MPAGRMYCPAVTQTKGASPFMGCNTTGCCVSFAMNKWCCVSICKMRAWYSLPCCYLQDQKQSEFPTFTIDNCAVWRYSLSVYHTMCVSVCVCVWFCSSRYRIQTDLSASPSTLFLETFRSDDDDVRCWTENHLIWRGHKARSLLIQRRQIYWGLCDTPVPRL